VAVEGTAMICHLDSLPHLVCCNNIVNSTSVSECSLGMYDVWGTSVVIIM